MSADSKVCVDGRAVEWAVKLLLVALGQNPECDALQDTPARVARAWKEQLAGYGESAERVLGAMFDADGYDGIVRLRDIPFHSTCEHHLLPFHGTADVAYVPREARVVGLSKLARLVDLHARRLQLQERMTQAIADDLVRVLDPVGVAVFVRAQHLCMCARGVAKAGASMMTSAVRGCFRDKPELLAMVSP